MHTAQSVLDSGVPRILEWEGSMCRRRRGRLGVGRRVFPSPIPPPHWGKGLGGAVPIPRKFFVFFVENTIF